MRWGSHRLAEARDPEGQGKGLARALPCRLAPRRPGRAFAPLLLALPWPALALSSMLFPLTALLAPGHAWAEGASAGQPRAAQVQEARAEGGHVEAGAPRPAAASLQIGGQTVRLEIAQDDAEWEAGLSGRAGLPLHTGLWFAFRDTAYHGIWMKDMRFPIDILWLDTALRIVGIKENARPDSYPSIFRPPQPARYVLEIAAGFCAAHGVHLGDPARLVLSPPQPPP